MVTEPTLQRHTEQSNGAEQPTLALALVSATGAAARLGVSSGFLARPTHDGRIPALRPGLNNYYVPADLALPGRTCQQCGASLVGLATNPATREGCRAVRQATRPGPAFRG